MSTISPAHLEQAQLLIREQERKVQMVLADVKRDYQVQRDRLNRQNTEFRDILRKFQTPHAPVAFSSEQHRPSRSFFERQLALHASQKQKLVQQLGALDEKARPLQLELRRIEAAKEKLAVCTEMFREALSEVEAESRIREDDSLFDSPEGAECLSDDGVCALSDGLLADDSDGGAHSCDRGFEQGFDGGDNGAFAEGALEQELSSGESFTREESEGENSEPEREVQFSLNQQQNFTELSLRYPLSSTREVEIRVVARDGKQLDLCLLWPAGEGKAEVYRVRADVISDLRAQGFFVRTFRAEYVRGAA